MSCRMCKCLCLMSADKHSLCSRLPDLSTVTDRSVNSIFKLHAKPKAPKQKWIFSASYVCTHISCEKNKNDIQINWNQRSELRGQLTLTYDPCLCSGWFHVYGICSVWEQVQVGLQRQLQTQDPASNHRPGNCSNSPVVKMQIYPDRNPDKGRFTSYVPLQLIDM